MYMHRLEATVLLTIYLSSELILILALAIIGAGGIFASTNPSYTHHELTHTLKISKARFVFTELDLVLPMREAMITAKISTSCLFVL
jgi:acyl-CoA synthetase (AMP-forming)/AMP-acid ligase II